MELERELKDQTIVILAQNFNPSVFNQHWLIKKRFIDENEFLSNSFFTPNVVQVSTSDYNLVVTPEQLNIVLKTKTAEFSQIIKKTLIPIIKSLKEVPYKAVGININWQLKTSKETFSFLSKKYFHNKDLPISSFFKNQSSLYGAYLSKDLLSCRLRLDIKPMILKEKSRLEYTILFNFNYHKELESDNASQLIIKHLNNWNKFYSETLKMITSNEYN